MQPHPRPPTGPPGPPLPMSFPSPIVTPRPDDAEGRRVRVLPEHRLGVVWLRGPIEAADLLLALPSLYLHPAWVPGFKTAWDALEVTSLSLSPEDLERIVEAFERLAPTMGGGPSAYLTRGGLEEMMAELLRIRRDRIVARPTHGFHDAAAAAAWLEVPVSALQR